VILLSYGDVLRIQSTSLLRRSVATKFQAVALASAGPDRHAVLVRAFIQTGELVQGLADQEFGSRGADDVSELQAVAAGLLIAQGKAILRSWDDSFCGVIELPGDWRARLERLESPDPVRLKRAEGYAFYAVYPESYLEAARRSRLAPDTVVIGLRSIGTSLAALVAAAIGAPTMFTLRPVGPPFGRQLAVGKALTRKILSNHEANFAIVDEGPGLSGSSFGSVADWLTSHGVATHRIHFFPSHEGKPGPQVSATHSVYWDTVQRHFTGIEDLLLSSPDPRRRLSARVSRLTGERLQASQDISGGRWRAIRYPNDKNWPPSQTWMEKRKFLMHTDKRPLLVKFAGLDDLAHQKLRRSAILSEAGFTPTCVGLTYGFIVEHWVQDAPGNLVAVTKDDVVDRVGRYLGFRARHLPPLHGGASLSELCSMSISNTREALGEEGARKAKALMSDAASIQRRLRRVDTDNRLHRWEWLVDSNRTMIKTDALDHNAAHDFVGCQDIAWDIAGATVEFDLSVAETSRLAQIVGREAGTNTDEDILRLFELCYLAFQIGHWTNAAAAAPDGDDRIRLEGTIRRYLGLLKVLLEN
jgi:hypothetical protein